VNLCWQIKLGESSQCELKKYSLFKDELKNLPVKNYIYIYKMENEKIIYKKLK